MPPYKYDSSTTFERKLLEFLLVLKIWYKGVTIFNFSLFDILLIDLFLFNSGSSELKMKQLQLDCEFKNVERGGFPQGLNPRLAVSCNNHYCNIIVAIRLKCFQYHPQLKNFLATAQTFVAKFQWCEM